MRGKVTDQDLTNYALNELSPNERLYVESMLAVSEECRYDVYQMLDLGELLKEGLEEEESAIEFMLNDEQRARVITVPGWHWRGFFQRAAAVALLAAGSAYALTRPALWQQGGAADKLANATGKMGTLVAEAREKGFVKSAEEYIAARMQATKQADGSEFHFVAAECTPSPIFELPPMPPMPVEM